jgi:hypothetical protein
MNWRAKVDMKFANKSIAFLLGFGMLIMTFSFFIFGSTALTSDSIVDSIITGVLAICSLIAPVGFIITGRQWFSYFVIDENGIANKIFFLKSKDIFIAWDEIEDIAIKAIGKGHGIYSEYMYFCKMPLDEYWESRSFYKLFKKIPSNKESYAMGQDENLISITYSKQLLDEVLKYVDKERIRNINSVLDKA